MSDYREANSDVMTRYMETTVSVEMDKSTVADVIYQDERLLHTGQNVVKLKCFLDGHRAGKRLNHPDRLISGGA
ncbi:hypothetical protein ANANG_G00017860 [Anguilla anguilla]|uniref:Uncharacterized protein n=1 Tax=Anguilla anguilla TaxID=7936 RepID=A0A9D3N1U2_ANGAN|nr:hypothetical protein ANANG_G00017860 [Anguilla anguilla]